MPTSKSYHRHPPVPPSPVPGTFRFADEFNGPAGAGPDPSKWVCQVEPQSNENSGTLGTYTASRVNSYQDGSGHLVLKAVKSGSSVTSARLVTLGKYSQLYGSWQARIKWAHTAGCWPAWWCMGSSPSSYPACGEVDMFEAYGNSWEPGTTVWSPGGGDMANSRTVSAPAMQDGNWHVWQMDWVKGAGFRFYQDGTRYFAVTPAQLPNWTYDSGNPFYMVLDIAVGGSGGGAVPSGFTSAELLVDYVHVW